MSQKNSQPVGDPDLQTREGGGGHTDPEKRGGGGSDKKIFGPSGLSLV